MVELIAIAFEITIDATRVVLETPLRGVHSYGYGPNARYNPSNVLLVSRRRIVISSDCHLRLATASRGACR